MSIMKLFRYIVRALLSIVVIPVAVIIFSSITLVRVLLSVILGTIVIVFIGSWGIVFSTYIWSINGDFSEIEGLIDLIKCIADIGDVCLFSGIPDMWRDKFYYVVIKVH